MDLIHQNLNTEFQWRNHESITEKVEVGIPITQFTYHASKYRGLDFMPDFSALLIS